MTNYDDYNVHTYLTFLAADVLVFGSERTSSSESKEMTSSKTTPRGLDF